MILKITLIFSKKFIYKITFICYIYKKIGSEGVGLLELSVYRSVGLVKVYCKCGNYISTEGVSENDNNNKNE